MKAFNKKRIFKRFIARLTHPQMWLRNYTCSEEVDVFFNLVIENIQEVEDFGTHTIKFRKCKIWIENHMYASPTIDTICVYALPYADTTVKFFKALEKESIRRALIKE